MSTVVKSVRINKNALAEYAKKHDNINKKLSQSIELMPLARLNALKEIRGLFTSDEWKFFADSLCNVNATAQFRFNKNAFWERLIDFKRFEGTKFDVNIETLKKKIDKLTTMQVEAIYSRVDDFWEASVSSPLEQWAKEWVE